MLRVETSTCTTCGAQIDSSVLGDEDTCMVCLLRIGLEGAEGPSNEDSLGASLPDHIGPYVIARRDDGRPWRLGRGAMGVTYRAIDESLQRPVALKIINTKLGSRSAEARERFTREARAAALLKHPNVATVYQFGVREETGHFFYAMELVEGETLEERVCRLGPLDVLTTIDVALQVTAALAAAEEHGLVHRDLKPGNLMLVGGDNAAEVKTPRRGVRSWRDRLRPVRARTGKTQRSSLQVKVIDFGVAKAIADKSNAMALTRGGFVGTPAFASPEQFSNAPVDVRSDIYSLGATLWFLLTGHMLFGGETVEEMRDSRQSKSLPIEQLKAARVPGRFISLLRSMLAVEPAARPAGARALAAKLQAIRTQITGRRKSPGRVAVVASVFALGTIIAVRLFHLTPPPAPLIPEKSIAVLPFQSFSDDKQDAYFADSVQDEILTDLTKVADVKVISRRSVAQYRDAKQSVRQIGQALGVSHVLEGTVRKTANRIHVTTQLIDARNEAQTWAEKYDRDIADLQMVQNDISEEVVSRLKATLSPNERAAIEEKPTQDQEAYDLYLRARPLVYGQAERYTAKGAAENAGKAIPLLEAAVVRDPEFTLAYCALADAELMLDHVGASWEKIWLEKAKQAIDAALRVSPNSAEAHLVAGEYFVQGLKDAAAAEKELNIAAGGLPGRAEVYNWRGRSYDQQAKWKDALHDRERAVELDPRNSDTADDLIQLYLSLRWYDKAERLTNHMIAITPRELSGSLWRKRSNVALARADAKAAMVALDSYPQRNNGSFRVNEVAGNVFIMERDYRKAEDLFQSIVETAKTSGTVSSVGEQGKELLWRGLTQEKLGRIARFQGESEKAHGYFEAARPYFEEWLAKGPGENHWRSAHGPAYIAEIDAALGRKENAIREGRKVAELWSVKRDAVIGPDIQIFLAIVYTWSGEREAALQTLSEVAKVPVMPSIFPMCPGLSAGELKLNPLWDELRSDPRFEKIIAEAGKPIKLD
jgi:serine/threonine protein kinase/tetratricopeptide (TPR) repeat protein